MGVANAVSAYSYIGLGGNAFYDNGFISIQAVIDMLANSDFSLDNLYNAITAKGSVLSALP